MVKWKKFCSLNTTKPHHQLVMTFNVFFLFSSFLNLVQVFFCFHVWFLSVRSHFANLFSALSHILSMVSSFKSQVSCYWTLLLFGGTWDCEVSSDEYCMTYLTSKFHWALKLSCKLQWFSCLLRLRNLKHQTSNYHLSAPTWVRLSGRSSVKAPDVPAKLKKYADLVS